MKPEQILKSAISVFLASIAISAHATPGYTVTDLGVLGGTYSDSRAYGINSLGQVVGQSDTGTGDTHAFIYSNGQMQDIGTLGGGIYGSARAINNNGTVVGSATGAGFFGIHAFQWSSATGMQDINPSQAFNSQAYGINNAGTAVAKMSYIYGYGNTGFTYSNGNATYLGDPYLGYMAPRAVNAAGISVGDIQQLSYVSLIQKAYSYDGQNITVLGALTGYNYQAVATSISDSGIIVGYSRSFQLVPHAFMYVGGSMVDLGTLQGDFSAGSAAFGTNNKGDIVGDAYQIGTDFGFVSPDDSINSYDYGGTEAFILHDGIMTALNNLVASDSGWNLLDAKGINDQGQIVGEGIINGSVHAYILNPIPEPGSLALVLLPLAYLLKGRIESPRKVVPLG